MTSEAIFKLPAPIEMNTFKALFGIGAGLLIALLMLWSFSDTDRRPEIDGMHRVFSYAASAVPAADAPTLSKLPQGHLPPAAVPQPKNFHSSLAMILGRSPSGLKKVYLAGLLLGASDEQRYLSYLISQSCLPAVTRQALPDHAAFPKIHSYAAAEARKRIDARCEEFYALPIGEFRASAIALDNWYSSSTSIISAGYVSFGRSRETAAIQESRSRLAETLKAYGPTALLWVSEGLSDHLISLTSSESDADPTSTAHTESLIVASSILAKCDAFPDACVTGGLIEQNICSTVGTCGDVRKSLLGGLNAEDGNLVKKRSEQIVRAISTGDLSSIGL